MYILGISEIDNDAGAVLLKDDHVVCGANEERFSRVKRHRGFPHKTVEWILNYSGLTLNDIDHIAVAKADHKGDEERFFRVKKHLLNYNYIFNDDSSGVKEKIINYYANKYRNIPRYVNLATKMNNEILAWAEKKNCQHKIRRVHHHYCHAVCAYWASGFDNAIAITIDGQGEGATSEVYLVENGTFTLLKEIKAPNSLGQFYASITKALGFKPARHEGKVTGLAAYGNPPEELLDKIRKLAYINKEGEFSAPCIYGNYLRIVGMLRKYGRNDMSAAFQSVLEEVASKYVDYYMSKYEVSNLVLAGGVVANVKLNQRLHEIEEVKNIFVFPHMADGGLGYGAAQAVYRELSNSYRPSPIKDVYWGPDFSDTEIEKALKESGLNYEHKENIAKDIAELLMDKKVVAHFNGRMEFGPRALGNRSILYRTTDKSVNDWLNEKLERSEFMPFAPVTLKERIADCYIKYEGAEFASKFMTITFNCTQQMKEQSPAVVHVDGTARPQLIDRDDNPRYYDILNEYYKLTGNPSLVNTSFNMHEEPIVCTPSDAIRAYVDGDLDCLAIGYFLVRK